MNRFTIGRLAKEAGVTVETVRYYERRGLLTRPVPSGETTYREYSRRDVAILQHIKLGKAVGLRLREIRELIALLGEGPPFCEAFRQLLRTKLAFVQAECQRLRQVETRLTEALSACEIRAGNDCPIQRELGTR